MATPVQQPTLLTVEGRLVGTDAPTRTVQQTQSTPGLNVNFSAGSFGNFNANTTSGIGISTGSAIAQPFQNGGVGSQRDDNTQTNKNETQRLVSSTTTDITPLANVLDQYASYTYALSWYLITPEQLAEMQQSYKINPASWQLLVQSGGAPTKPTGGSETNRNQYFKYDYYIDNLVMETLFQGKGSGQAHNVATCSFTITEPLGITLVKNLYNAVNDLYKLSGNSKDSPNFTAGNYVMAIRFYGYDDNGNLAKRSQTNSNSGYIGDPYSIVEKYFPFIISELEYSVTSKGNIEYKISGTATPYAYNTSAAYGSIPSQYELVGQTVGEILNGNPVSTNANNSQDGRPTTPSPTQGTTPNTPPTDNNGNPIGNNGWGEG